MDTTLQPKKTIYDGMKKYTRANLKDVALEGKHMNTSIASHPLSSSKFEPLAKGHLEPGASYDWHTHEAADEMAIILQGKGKFYWKEELIEYIDGDIFTIPAGTMHKFTAEGNTPSQFFFVRAK